MLTTGAAHGREFDILSAPIHGNIVELEATGDFRQPLLWPPMKARFELCLSRSFAPA